MRLLQTFKKDTHADALLVSLKTLENIDMGLSAVDNEGKAPRKERLNKKRDKVCFWNVAPPQYIKIKYLRM